MASGLFETLETVWIIPEHSQNPPETPCFGALLSFQPSPCCSVTLPCLVRPQLALWDPSTSYKPWSRSRGKVVFPTPSTKRSLGMPQLCPLPLTSGDPPLPSSAGGEALPAAQRVKSTFRHHLLPASTQQAIPPADTQCSEQPCAGRAGRSTRLGFTCWGESVQIPQARAATAPCPPVRPGARLSRCSQHTQNTHIHCMYTYVYIETHQSLAI